MLVGRIFLIDNREKMKELLDKEEIEVRDGREKKDKEKVWKLRKKIKRGKKRLRIDKRSIEKKDKKVVIEKRNGLERGKKRVRSEKNLIMIEGRKRKGDFIKRDEKVLRKEEEKKRKVDFESEKKRIEKME